MTRTQRNLLIPLTLVLATASSMVVAEDDSDGVDLGTLFRGSWTMEGRFRHTPEMEWIATGSSALIFEGTCSEGCRQRELEQLCGPAWPHPACDGRSTITFESEDRFVARDSRPGPDGEYFLTREVFYTRNQRSQPDAATLAGTWRVDLRPTPNAEPYYQELVILEAGESLEGSFYGTPFTNFEVNGDWGELRFAFATDDGSGIYHTSGRWVDGRLEGTTHSLGRGFLSVWTAERTDPR